MIRLSVFYPKGEGKTFDHEYYRDKHIPMALSIWKPLVVEIDKGIDGPYEAAAHFTFASKEDLQAAMTNPEIKSITADLRNYTDITPVMQTSSIEKSERN